MADKKRQSAVIVGMKFKDDVSEIVVPASEECRTIQDIKDCMVKSDVRGDVYVVRAEPIRRVEKITFE